MLSDFHNRKLTFSSFSVLYNKLATKKAALSSSFLVDFVEFFRFWDPKKLSASHTASHVNPWYYWCFRHAINHVQHMYNRNHFLNTLTHWFNETIKAPYVFQPYTNPLPCTTFCQTGCSPTRSTPAKRYHIALIRKCGLKLGVRPVSSWKNRPPSLASSVLLRRQLLLPVSRSMNLQDHAALTIPQICVQG